MYLHYIAICNAHQAMDNRMHKYTNISTATTTDEDDNNDTGLRNKYLHPHVVDDSNDRQLAQRTHKAQHSAVMTAWSAYHDQRQYSICKFKH